MFQKWVGILKNMIYNKIVPKMKRGDYMNLNKLNAKIVENGLKKKDVANKLGISVQALNKKLNGTTKITTIDAILMCSIIGIKDNAEKVDIFLT